MKMVTFGEETYTLDNHGYLEAPDIWDHNFAEGMAGKHGIFDGLEQMHWRVIGYLREKFEQEQMVPYFVHACMDTGLTIAQFRGLFPTGYLRGACRIAGLSYAFIAAKNFALTYEHLPSLWSKYRLCPLGFLEDFDSWDENFANLVAQPWDLPCGLTGAHWKVLHFLRDHFRAHAKVPLVYHACKKNNLSLEELSTLFPGGYHRGACRAAGLPFVD